MLTVIVDILCLQSLYKVLKLPDKINIVYYCSVSKYISLILKLISYFRHIKFKAFSEYASSTLYQNQRSCYEEIETRLIDFCNLYIKKLEDDAEIIAYCRTNKLDFRLTTEFLRHNAYWLLYRPVEIMVKSELLDADDRFCFVLRDSPVINILIPVIKSNHVKIVFYQYWGFSFFLKKQDEFIFDLYIKETYLSNPLFQAFKTPINIILFAVNSFCSQMLGNDTVDKQSEKKNKAGIGIDKYLNSAEEDCFWFKDSQIDPADIYYFEERTPSRENIEYLTKNKFRRVHIVSNPVEWFKKKASPSGENRQLVSAEWGNIKKSLRSYLAQWAKGLLFYDSKKKWETLMLLQLQIAYELWKNVFQQLGIKMLLSLSEIDSLKTAKMMAANYSQGVVLSGHLSNTPLNYVPQERFFHIVFVWGAHFHPHIFGRCTDKTVIITGYYLDYKFKAYFLPANIIRMKYPDKFIITFMDNVFSQDIPYSAETMKKAYGMFFDIIDAHENVVIFVKAKRDKYFNKTRRIVPAIDKHINRGKVVPFINDPNTNQPYKPASIALASDLVIGIGISTAATESQFAGVPSFHFDLSKTQNNQFAKDGLGTIVFQSVESMREAIEKQINPNTALPYEIIDHSYRDLDPFRDGWAAFRIGNYLSWLWDGFNAGLGRENALNNAAKRYSSAWGQDKIISIN
jgi:hypothetical protein